MKERRMKIEALEIPNQAKDLLRSEGLQTLYPPQEEAVELGVLGGANMVLASPTASGKTLVAELCAIKKVIEEGGKVLYLTPLRALASEKFSDFSKYSVLEKKGGHRLKVVISTGDYDGSDPWLARYDIIITTNEKCDSLIRHRAKWMEEISLIVADEVHVMNDPERGSVLEVVLTRLVQVCPRAQVLALSATIKNAEEIAKWLKAKVVSTNWRPVKLKEGVLYNDVLLFNDGSSANVKRMYDDSSLNLSVGVIGEGGQTLIFAESRKKAVALAKAAAPILGRLLPRDEKLSLREISSRILSAGEKTRISELLSELVGAGVAFHHAGLSPSQRKIVEDEFRKGRIKLISATPTLAAGVNLPARTVVIHSYERYSPGFGRTPISVLEYKQMAGRAGRPKYDDIGEAVLIARAPDEQEYLMSSYVCAEPERIWSRMGTESVLRTHVLSTVASGFAFSEKGIMEFFGRTFFSFQYGVEVLGRTIGKVIKLLLGNDLIKVEKGALSATSFGRRVSELYIDPLSAIRMREALMRDDVTVNEIGLLHLICHTPDLGVQLYPRSREMEHLQLYLEKHLSDLFFRPSRKWEDPINYELFLGEIKMTKVLEDWADEASEDSIIDRYGVEPGDLYRLVDKADWLLYSTQEMAKLFGKEEAIAEIALTRNRVANGVRAELVPLVRLKDIGRIRARSLFNAGLRTIEDLKRASLEELMAVPVIGPKVAKSIKEQVGGTFDEGEWKKLKKENWEQKKLTEV